MNRSRSIMPGVIFIALGVLFFGMVNKWWHLDWRYVFMLWPVILIVVGLQMVLPRTRWADWLVAGLVAIGIIGFVAAPESVKSSLTGIHLHTGTSARIEQAGANTVSRLIFKTNLSASDVHFTALDEASSKLYTATSHGATLHESIKRTESLVTTELNPDFDWLATSRSLDIAIARQPALELSLDSGASHSVFELQNLNLISFKLDGGANDATITLGSKSPQQTVSFDSGASDLKIRVPTAAALKITKDGGLINDNFDSLGLSHSEDTYTSAGFDATDTQITISFTGGASNINIERY